MSEDYQSDNNSNLERSTIIPDAIDALEKMLSALAKNRTPDVANVPSYREWRVIQRWAERIDNLILVPLGLRAEVDFHKQLRAQEHNIVQLDVMSCSMHLLSIVMPAALVDKISPCESTQGDSLVSRESIKALSMLIDPEVRFGLELVIRENTPEYSESAYAQECSGVLRSEDATYCFTLLITEAGKRRIATYARHQSPRPWLLERVRATKISTSCEIVACVQSLLFLSSLTPGQRFRLHPLISNAKSQNEGDGSVTAQQLCLSMRGKRILLTPIQL